MAAAAGAGFRGAGGPGTGRIEVYPTGESPHAEMRPSACLSFVSVCLSPLARHITGSDQRGRTRFRLRDQIPGRSFFASAGRRFAQERNDGTSFAFLCGAPTGRMALT